MWKNLYKLSMKIKYGLVLLLLGFLPLGLSGCGVSHGDQVTLTFAWQQDLPEPNDLKEWRLYKSLTSGGPYEATPVAVFPFTTVQAEYSGQATINYPAGQRTRYYYVLTAVDTSGNESGYSNEVFWELDFQAPNAPRNLIIR